MECTRALSHVQASSTGMLRIQRVSLRKHLTVAPVALRPRRAALSPVASASITEPASSGSSSATDYHDASRVLEIASGEAFQEVMDSNPGKLIVLMCKATGCRPCKAFKPKFAKLADHYTDAVFAEVLGDRNESTRNLMRSLAIRSTPTFVFHRNGEKVHAHSGINADKMVDALKLAVLPEEAGFCEEVKFAADLLKH